MKLDEKKLAKLKATNQQLNEKYGEHGTDTREKFNEKSMAWYYGDILRERRKVEKPLNFDPFGHARFAHLFVLYD